LGVEEKKKPSYLDRRGGGWIGTDTTSTTTKSSQEDTESRGPVTINAAIDIRRRRRRSASDGERGQWIVFVVVSSPAALVAHPASPAV
jgi:hypothetical protein